MTLEKQWVALDPLMDSIKQSHHHQLLQKNLSFDYFCDNPEKAWVQADPNYIKIAISEIIQNAVKYTDRGGIGIAITKHQDLLTITVQDSGVGMTKEQQQRLFQFEQTDGSHTRLHQGLGMGLLMTKKIMELHNGEMHITSEINKGTIVELIFHFDA